MNCETRCDNRLATSVDDRASREKSLHRMQVRIAGRLLHKFARMNELVPEPRIVVRVEYASHPIDHLRDALGFPDIGMIGQPDIEREMDANVDRNDGSVQGAGIGRKSADPGASLDRVENGRARVRAQSHYVLDTVQPQQAGPGIRVDLGSRLLDQTMMGHVGFVAREAIAIDIAARRQWVDMQAPE